MDIDKNEVLKKAEELLEDNKSLGDIEVSDMEKQSGSYDDEKKMFESDDDVTESFLEEPNENSEHKLGYKREPQYKPPSFLKISLAIVLIIILGIIIGLMLPYTPPIL